MKGTFLTLICAFALASATENSEVAVNHLGCPIDISLHWFIPHEYCDRYYKCVVGMPYLIHCPNGTAFDTEKNVCNTDSKVECGNRKWPLFGYDDPSKAKEICKKSNSNNILISHEVCSQYYICNNGRPLALSCAGNLYYNPKNGQCDWQQNVDCKNVGVVDPNWTEAEKECSKGKFLVRHEYCNWFYKCGPQGPKAMACPKNTVFNFKIQTCDWPAAVDCRGRPIKLEETEEVTKPTKPEVTEPPVIEPEVTEPPVIEPEETEPEVIVPEENEPGSNEAGSNEAGSNEAGTTDPEVDDVIIGLPGVEN